MNSTYTKILVILVAFLFGFFLARAIPPAIVVPTLYTETNPTVSIMLDFGDDELISYTKIPFTDNMSVFDVLLHLNDSDTITIEYDDYGANMGVLINSIEGRKNGGPQNRYWQY